MAHEVIVEIPKGSRNKYEYDHDRGVMRLDRMLFTAMQYPSDYGFFPDTLAEDGDPLDALVLLWEPTFPGCLIEVEAVGVFKMRDEKGIDHKVLCRPVGEPMWAHIAELDDVPPHLLREIEHFFTVYKDLEKKKTGVEGWEDRGEAERVITEARARFEEQGKGQKHED